MLEHVAQVNETAPKSQCCSWLGKRSTKKSSTFLLDLFLVLGNLITCPIWQIFTMEQIDCSVYG